MDTIDDMQGEYVTYRMLVVSNLAAGILGILTFPYFRDAAIIVFYGWGSYSESVAIGASYPSDYPELSMAALPLTWLFLGGLFWTLRYYLFFRNKPLPPSEDSQA